MGKVSKMQPKELFEKLMGQWKGSCKTWFEPGKLADESLVSGDFTEVLGGRFVRHTYQGQLQDKPRRGEELIAFNTVTEAFQMSWIDDFHMNYAIMFSEGEATDRGFNVHGNYEFDKDQPSWGWRTGYRLIDDDQLTITAYNITPGGHEAKAIETKYERVN